MSVTIRPARDADTEAVAALHGYFVDHTLVTFTTERRSLSDWQDDILYSPPLLVAEEEGGGFLGFAYFTSFRGGPGYARTAEHSIYLTEAAAGRGVGRRLLAALEKQAQEHGIHVLVAAISSANQAAQDFHRACGYAETGRLPQVGCKWGRWLDLVLMQKILTPGIPAPDSAAEPG
ncbi:GNAT family N-acetyltransferase [Leisingera daeponensis]|uniref:GNAT family N-acetyltransferase n=1 Tax=Leisingera daeponensis TaxID=405746 RepID=UPI001C98C7D7|nr:GNAT family N-acetyltransferase [Leisingera daeponensis]MBY6055543.1 GNAT family N-acetyltransferase [Leisingera daeponensis]